MAVVITEDTVWAPQLTENAIQVALGLLTIPATLWVPWAVVATIPLAVLFPVLSASLDIDVWHMQPESDDWRSSMVKLFAVAFMASLPMLLVRILPLGKSAMQCFGFYISIALILNILWTLNHVEGWTDKVNGVGAVLLCLIVVVQIVKLVARGEAIVEKSPNGLAVLAHMTPLPWTICYTVWNAIFISRYRGLHSIIHLFTPWCGMFFAHWAIGGYGRLEDNFGYQRATTLGTYLIVSKACGMLDYFRETPLDPGPTDQTLFMLFMAYTNDLVLFALLTASVAELVKLRLRAGSQ
mmetsp:Transcript_43922/g.127873  ORF Transcript_43922/g.127873 Transcript_43922/m.127873 type:complete len:296 (-) Transcript_43922:238-1125(-)